jgi:hypothetical protein
MGGVDLVDMRRLHCNLTIMGQNQWWLKLFSICSMLELQMHWFCTMNQRESEKKNSFSEHGTFQNEALGRSSWEKHQQPK